MASPTIDGEPERERIAANLPLPTAELALPLIAAHEAARDSLRTHSEAKVGWSIANGAVTAAPGGERKLRCGGSMRTFTRKQLGETSSSEYSLTLPKKSTPMGSYLALHTRITPSQGLPTGRTP